MFRLLLLFLFFFFFLRKSVGINKYSEIYQYFARKISCKFARRRLIFFCKIKFTLSSKFLFLSARYLLYIGKV